MCPTGAKRRPMETASVSYSLAPATPPVPVFSAPSAVGTPQNGVRLPHGSSSAPELALARPSGQSLALAFGSLANLWPSLDQRSQSPPASFPRPSGICVSESRFSKRGLETQFFTRVFQNVVQKRKFWSTFFKTPPGNAVSGSRFSKRGLETQFFTRVFQNVIQKRGFWSTFGQRSSRNAVGEAAFPLDGPAAVVSGPPPGPGTAETRPGDGLAGPAVAAAPRGRRMERRAGPRWPPAAGRPTTGPGPPRCRAAATPPLCLSLNIRRLTIPESLSTNLGYFLTGLWPHTSPSHQP